MIPKKLLDEINVWITEKRYGSLEINFRGGEVMNVNSHRSIKLNGLAESVTITQDLE